MLAEQEYRQYITSSDKTIFESVVTLENSENNHQEYFKRLLLRHSFIYEGALLLLFYQFYLSTLGYRKERE